jgi:hypothetical protein
MGFVLVEEREVAGTRGARQSIPHKQAKTSPTWAKTTDIARKATGLALVIAAHILAIGILQLIRAEPQSDPNTTAMIVTNIPLRPPTKDVQAEAPQSQEEPAPQPKASSEPAEWFKAKIQVPEEPSAPTVPTAQTGAPIKPIALPSASSAPSTSGYDPYAGVAPLRQTAGPLCTAVTNQATGSSAMCR